MLLKTSEYSIGSKAGSFSHDPDTVIDRRLENDREAQQSFAADRQAVASGHVAETREALMRNVSFGIVTRVGYLVSRVFIPPFVLARLGLPAYGLWSAVFLIIGYVGTTSLGFTVAYIKLVAEFAGRGENHKANSILSTGMLLCGLVCGGLFALIMLGMPQILCWLSVPAELQSNARYLILMVVGIHMTDVVLSVFKASLAGCQKLKELQSIWVIEYLLEAALIFYLVGTGHGLYGLADAYVISTAASIILGVAMARRNTPWLRLSPRLCSWASLRQLMNFGGVVQFSALVSNAVETAERAIAAPLLGLNAVGLLDISAKLPRTSSSIPVAFAAAFIPAASYLHGGLESTAKRTEVIRQLYLKGSRYVTFSMATLSGLMATASAALLVVWVGRIYPGTAYLMTIFAVQQHLRLMTAPGTSILQGVGRPWEEFAYNVPNLLLAATMIPLSRLILGQWSVVGLGTAIVAASILASIGFIVRANRVLEVPARQYLRAVIMPSLVPYLIGGLIAIPLWSAVASVSRWQGAMAIGVAGTLYLALLVLVADRFILEREERRWFGELIRRQVAAVIGAVA